MVAGRETRTGRLPDSVCVGVSGKSRGGFRADSGRGDQGRDARGEVPCGPAMMMLVAGGIKGTRCSRTVAYGDMDS